MGLGACGAQAACRCPINAQGPERGVCCLRSFWKPGCSHCGLALTSTWSRTTRRRVRGPARSLGQALHTQPSLQQPAHLLGLQMCWHQRLEALGFLPQTSPQAISLPWLLDLGAAGRQRPTWPVPSSPGALSPSQLPVWHCRTPQTAPSLCLAPPAHRDQTGKHVFLAHEAGRAAPGGGTAEMEQTTLSLKAQDKNNSDAEGAGHARDAGPWQWPQQELG